jgi:hypothetical protein
MLTLLKKWQKIGRVLRFSAQNERKIAKSGNLTPTTASSGRADGIHQPACQPGWQRRPNPET